jgi:hypothetical protein
MKSFSVKVSKAWAIKRALAYQVIGFQLNSKGAKRLKLKDCDSVELAQAIKLGYVKAIQYISWIGATWFNVDYKGGDNV